MKFHFQVSKWITQVLTGHFQLFSTSKNHVDTKEMMYKILTLTGDFGRKFYFEVEGVKFVRKDHFGETGLYYNLLCLLKSSNTARWSPWVKPHST